MTVNIRHNGIKPDSTVASTELRVVGGSGERKALLYGAGKTERGARQQLLEQAKALRDELNLEIEDMIEDLCAHSRSWAEREEVVIILTIVVIFGGIMLWSAMNVGSYYIEFDGREYWVWRREFLGYNRCQGHFYNEADAQRCIEQRKSNPPRTIHPHS